MALKTAAAEELKTAEQVESYTSELRDRMRDDYDLYTLLPFVMPKEEGEWQNFTTNSPAVLANYVIDALSSAKRRIWIPLDAEKKTERNALSMTEKLAAGTIELGDNLLLTIPEVVDTQSALSWDATIRGWNCLRFKFYEENGEVIPDIAVWDALNTFWISGRKGLMWVCYRRYATKEDVESDYKGNPSEPEPNFNADKQGQIEIYNVWKVDTSAEESKRVEEGVIINNEYVEKKYHEDLESIPVFISPVGSTRLVHPARMVKGSTAGQTDTMKHVGESRFLNNRAIYEAESRMWTYSMTGAGRAAKSPIFIEFDSEKAPLTPDDIKTDPSSAGMINLLDVAKGQKFMDYLKPPSFEHIQYMSQGIAALISQGGIPPIAQGQLNQYLPASGIAELRNAAMTKLLPPKKSVQNCFVWLANEIRTQFKNGKYDEMTLSGVDKSGQEFEVEVSPDKIDMKRRFKCELILDKPQGELQDMGMAIQAIKSELLSPQTARDKWNLVDDTDLEQSKIDRYKASQFAEIPLWTMAKELWDEKTPDGKFGAMVILNKLAALAGQQGGQPGGNGGQGQQGVPAQPGLPPPPQAQTAARGPQGVPPEIREKVRLNNIGLERASS